jgi:hypothetical protein
VYVLPDLQNPASAPDASAPNASAPNASAPDASAPDASTGSVHNPIIYYMSLIILDNILYY